MIQKSPFKPTRWMSNPHLQTIWQTFLRRQPEVEIQRERFILPDGDFVDLDWTGLDGGPIVIVLHGIAGSILSPYAKGILRAIVDQKWRGVLMNFRGCSGEPNRLMRAYHSGDTDDLNAVVKELRLRHPNQPIAAVGFSMGGNVLLKWLGETGANNPLSGAVAVSVLLELEKSATHLNDGVLRLYQWWLLRDLRQLFTQKMQKSPEAQQKLSDLHTVRSLLEFDNKITAPLHGFGDAHDYYDKSSAKQYLKTITVPTLIVTAKDDPFLTKENAEPDTTGLPANMTVEVSEFGGHVGFVGGTPWRPKYWLEERIPEFLAQTFAQKKAAK